MKFSIKDFFSKSDRIRRKQWIWSHLLKKSSMENFIFCAVFLVPWCPYLSPTLTELLQSINSVDTGRKLNVHKMFRRRPRRLLNVFIFVHFMSCVNRELMLTQCSISGPPKNVNVHWAIKWRDGALG